MNQAKSDKNYDIFLNFVADTLGLRDIKISDNFFLSLNFSELARFSSLLLPYINVGFMIFWSFHRSLAECTRQEDVSVGLVIR